MLGMLRVLLGMVLTISAFQNCSKVAFEQMDQASTLGDDSAPGTCGTQPILCETSQGTGYLQCDDSSGTPVIGECALNSCKSPGLQVVDGKCVSGTSFINMTIDGAKSARVLPNRSYSLLITVSQAVLETTKLTKKSGSCMAQAQYSPFRTGLTSGSELSVGLNSWSVSQIVGQALSGCEWELCAETKQGQRSCVDLSAALCQPGQQFGSCTASDGSAGTLTCRADGLGQTCNPNPTPNGSCNFNGAVVAHGTSTRAYQSSSVAFGSNCQQQDRTCTNGVLSGSYGHSSCQVNPAQDCFVGATRIVHNSSIRTYQSAVVPSGSQCNFQDRVCYNGSLSGSFAETSCRVEQSNSCFFNGREIVSGGSMTAYESSSVPFGSSCNPQTRFCQNGVLSGSFTATSCTPQPARACEFNGSFIAHGSNRLAYEAATVPFGQTCRSQTRTCNNGNLDGGYAFSSCQTAPPLNCQLDGATILHGGSIDAFRSKTVGFGLICDRITRTCNNGVLSGSSDYQFKDCRVDDPVNCTFAGNPVANGASVTAYQTSSVAYDQTCLPEQRLCTNGILSGSYVNANCSPVQPRKCSFNGVEYNHNDTVRAYQTSSVGFDQTCAEETRRCLDGTWTGSYGFASCTVNQPSSCQFNNQTIAHGAKQVAFFTANVAIPNQCASQERNCYNGILSGSYNFASCSATCQASPTGEQSGIENNRKVLTDCACALTKDNSWTPQGLDSTGRACFKKVTNECVDGYMYDAASNSCVLKPPVKTYNRWCATKDDGSKFWTVANVIQPNSGCYHQDDGKWYAHGQTTRWGSDHTIQCFSSDSPIDDSLCVNPINVQAGCFVNKKTPSFTGNPCSESAAVSIHNATITFTVGEKLVGGGNTSTSYIFENSSEWIIQWSVSGGSGVCESGTRPDMCRVRTGWGIWPVTVTVKVTNKSTGKTYGPIQIEGQSEFVQEGSDYL